MYKKTLYYNFILIIFLSGCSTKVRKDHIVSDNYQIIGKHNNSISITVNGEENTTTDSLGGPKVPNKVLKESIEESIKNSEVFATIIKDGKAEYLLEVDSRRMDRPSHFPAHEVEIYFATHWQLTDLRTNKVIWKNLIATTHRTTIGDAFSGNARLRMTHEGAVKKNIQRGIYELSRLNLEGR